MVIGARISALPNFGPVTPELGAGTQLEGLRLLLLKAAAVLGTGDLAQVQQVCNDLTGHAANLHPAFGELFPPRHGLALADCDQQRRRVLLPLLEARAFYLAALRRWRRNLSLRRSLVDLQREAPAYDESEVSRWY